MRGLSRLFVDELPKIGIFGKCKTTSATGASEQQIDVSEQDEEPTRAQVPQIYPMTRGRSKRSYENDRSCKQLILLLSWKAARMTIDEKQSF